MWKKLCFISAAYMILASSCSKPYPLPPEQADWPVEAWQSSTPEEPGFDSGVFAEALLTMRAQQTPVHRLAIESKGRTDTELVTVLGTLQE